MNLRIFIPKIYTKLTEIWSGIQIWISSITDPGSRNKKSNGSQISDPGIRNTVADADIAPSAVSVD